MNKQELQDALESTKAKHKDDKLNTGDTCITLLCEDTLRVLNRCIEIPVNAKNGDMVKTMFPNAIKSNYIESGPDKDYVTIYLDDYEMMVDWDWWNAPYMGSEE